MLQTLVFPAKNKWRYHVDLVSSPQATPPKMKDGERDRVRFCNWFNGLGKLLVVQTYLVAPVLEVGGKWQCTQIGMMLG